jgi:hypothetical protein
MSILTAIVHTDRQTFRIPPASKLKQRILAIKGFQIAIIGLILSMSLWGQVSSVNASSGWQSTNSTITEHPSISSGAISLQAEICPIEGDLVVGEGETCSLSPGTYSYDSITIENGGTIISEGDTGANTGVTIQAESVTIQAGGRMTADGQGFARGQGPGAGGVYSSWTGGGGHGGYGGRGTYADATGGDAYGSIFEPITMGSGAGNASNSGTGAGAIHLIVSDALAIEGSLTANGDPGTLTQRGGGAGGSIWIETATLSGSGSIQANGGNGGGEGGGGGGGRIAIYADANSYIGTVQAYGGTGYQIGGPGTVYWGAEDRLVVNNNGKSGRVATLEAGDYSFTLIQLTGNGHLDLRESSSSLICDTIQGDNTST